MERGYVKLWRKLKDSDLMQYHNAYILFTWMLMTAQYQARPACIKATSVDLERGQLLYGRKYAAEKTFLSEQKVRTAFKFLHSTKRITSVSTSRGTVVTICNWPLYQSSEDEPNQQINQQVTSNQPASNHLQEGKKDKKVKNKSIRQRPKDEIWDAVVEEFGIENITPSDGKKIGQIVRDLKIKKATPDEIKRRGVAYRKKYPKMAYTMHALMNNWDSLKSSSHSLSPERQELHRKYQACEITADEFRAALTGTKPEVSPGDK